MPPQPGLITRLTLPEEWNRHPRGGGSLFWGSAFVSLALVVATAMPALAAQRGDQEAITEASLLAHEEAWPFHVTLVRPWSPPNSAKPLPVGIPAALIRVESIGNVARIDFGRDGVYTVPIAETDLVAEANRVRTRALEKIAPNFVLAIGPRLLDPSSDPPRQLKLGDAAESRAFLSVFADPGADSFGEIAGALRGVRAPPGVRTIVFPQGSRGDEAARARLRALQWPVPFVLAQMSEAYSRSYLPDGASPPFVMLVTSQGRLLFQRAWRPEIARELEAALAQALAEPGSAGSEGATR